MKRTATRSLAPAALLACFLLAGCATYMPNANDLKQQFATAVPLHSTPAQVLDYLDHQRIAHSPYRRDPSSGNKIEAELDIKTRHALIDPSYNLEFAFDDQDRLITSDVQFLGYVGL
jgi:ABC-type amino acid transport substrate-binding protein